VSSEKEVGRCSCCNSPIASYEPHVRCEVARIVEDSKGAWRYIRHAWFRVCEACARRLDNDAGHIALEAVNRCALFAEGEGSCIAEARRIAGD
jgi:hypothetical protein